MMKKHEACVAAFGVAAHSQDFKRSFREAVEGSGIDFEHATVRRERYECVEVIDAITDKVVLISRSQGKFKVTSRASSNDKHASPPPVEQGAWSG